MSRVLLKCFLLLQIFSQNRENAAITGHGERNDDLFIGNRRDGAVVEASASQSVDLGFILLLSHTERL